MAAAGLLHDRLIAAHCIHMTAADIHGAGAAGIAVAHSPVGNLASGRTAPILDLAAAGARILRCSRRPPTFRALAGWAETRGVSACSGSRDE